MHVCRRLSLSHPAAFFRPRKRKSDRAECAAHGREATPRITSIIVKCANRRREATPRIAIITAKKTWRHLPRCRTRGAPHRQVGSIPERNLEFHRRDERGHISLARAIGDESLVTSLRSLEAGRCESSELKTIGILGRETGIGIRASALIKTEHHLNDSTITSVPIRSMKVYLLSDSMLKLRKTKSTAVFQGPDFATTEKSAASSWAWRFGVWPRRAHTS